METIVNKVAESGILTLNLEHLLPAADTLATFDIAPYLFKGMILREKDFRTALQEMDWAPYAHKRVAVYCSAEAIIPMWAYMLIASWLYKCDAMPFHGNEAQLKEQLLNQAIDALDVQPYADGRVVVKGCGEVPLPESAFLRVSARLLPVVKSLMYGEPCSTVPIYKKK